MEKFVIKTATYEIKELGKRRLRYITFENSPCNDFVPRSQLVKIIETNPKKVFVKFADGNEYQVFCITYSVDPVIHFSGSCASNEADLGNVSGGFGHKDLEKIDLIDKYVLELVSQGLMNQRIISAAECVFISDYGYVETDKSGVTKITEKGKARIEQITRDYLFKCYDPKTNSVIDSED